MLQIAKQMEKAVAEASKPIPIPQPEQDPQIESFGRMVMNAMKKVPESDLMQIQIEVMEVFRNRERRASGILPSATQSVAPKSDFPPNYQGQTYTGQNYLGQNYPGQSYAAQAWNPSHFGDIPPPN